MILRSVASSSGGLLATAEELPFFIAPWHRTALDSPCPEAAFAAADCEAMSVQTLSLARASWRGVPPHAYFVASAIFHYLSPSIVVLLFERVEVLGVAWLRIAAAAAIFAVWRRPWRTFLALDASSRLVVVELGAVFPAMNACFFYLAIDRMPLATVAAIEFIGPILLALIGTRSGRNVAAVVCGAAGVFVLTGVQFGGDAVGVVSAFANAALFTGYIVVGHRVARLPTGGGIDGLAWAMLVALVFVSPVGVLGTAHAFADPLALVAGIGVVGHFSVPHMRHVGTSTTQGVLQGPELVASSQGQPARGAGAGAARILPVRGPVVSRRMLSSNPSPSRQSARSMKSVLPSSPPSMQAKHGRSVSTRCSTSPPSRTRSTLVPLASIVEHQMAPSASTQMPSPV